MLCHILLLVLSMNSLEAFFKSYSTTNIFPFKWRRTITSDVSCTQSPIQYNVTLKGGIEAGYFRKLAEHVAMQLCVELCCEEKGCDVAFMSGKNCYGVQCFNEEMCKGLPAKKQLSEELMMAHVTFKGESVVSTEQFTEKLQCLATKINTGVTLRGGLNAGNYTDVGTVLDMSMCVKLCCVSEKCDVALMINQSCFIVTCYSKKKCEMVKSFTNIYKPTLAYVMRKREPHKSEASLKMLQNHNNQLVCKNGQVFYNTTLKGGYQAGNYTNFGKVSNMSICVRMCCGNRDCDAAFMLENNCFAVACRNADNCSPVHAKASSSLAALNPRLSYITSRSEEVFIRDQITPDGTCHAGIISYDVSLKGGSAAGNFTPHGNIGSMEKCIYKCCQSEGCSVAMMLRDTCFTVVCARDELCEKKQTPTSSNFNPKIAYVFKNKMKRPTFSPVKEPHYNHKKKSPKKTLLAEQLYALTNSPTSFISQLEAFPVTTSSAYHSTMTSLHSTTKKSTLTSKTPKIKISIPRHDNESLLNATYKSSSNDLIKNFEPPDDSFLNFFLEREQNVNNQTSLFNGTLSLKCDQDCINNEAGFQYSKPQLEDVINVTKSFKKTSKNAYETNADGVNDTVTSVTSIRASLKKNVTLVEDDPNCKSSEVFYNVTLRGGLRSGKFKDRGEMEDIKQCVKICCLLENCDLAFMLSKTCFTVDCIDDSLCDAVPARSTIYSPSICYVYVKNTPNVET
ncbi:uncharacterized protein LOC101240327 isoform X2 [Hydra vulgaris]